MSHAAEEYRAMRESITATPLIKILRTGQEVLTELLR